MSWRSTPSDHFDVATQRFFNPWKDTDKTFGDVVRWWWSGNRRPWPSSVRNTPYPPPPERVDPDRVAVTFVGHATVLIRTPSAVILTDPHFSSHAGAYGRLGAPRVRQPGLTVEQMPPVDIVFVSHTHFDHLDLPSIGLLARRCRPTFVTGLGVGPLLRRAGATTVTEIDWWSNVTAGGLSLTLTPAQHWSNRSPFDRRKTLWGGCYVQDLQGASVYFAGDSGYATCFAEVRKRLGPPDVALLPIGAYEPRWIMEDNHMNPAEAVRAHGDLGAGCSIAIHHQCFRLSDEGFDEPVRDLEAARQAAGITPDEFRVVDVGETVVLSVRAGRPAVERTPDQA
jgi:L-ascorbate metabolism protein UlaG (beta-lactamase superfamily)